MKSAGHRMGSVKELDTYIRDPRAISGHVQVPLIAHAKALSPLQCIKAIPALWYNTKVPWTLLWLGTLLLSGSFSLLLQRLVLSRLDDPCIAYGIEGSCCRD